MSKGIGDGGGESQLPCRVSKDKRDEAKNQAKTKGPKEHKAKHREVDEDKNQAETKEH